MSKILILIAALFLSGTSVYAQTAEVYDNRGYADYMQGNLSQAIADYTKAIKIKPNYEKAYRHRGIAYYAQGNITQAISDYNKAIEINPKDLGAYYNRGIAYQKQGNSAQAFSDYIKSVEIDTNQYSVYGSKSSNTDYAQTAQGYYNKGIIDVKERNFDQAISDYTKSIELNPKDAYAYDGRCFAHYKKGNFAQAISDCTKSIDTDSKDRTYSWDPYEPTYGAMSSKDSDDCDGRGGVIFPQGGCLEGWPQYDIAKELNPHSHAYYFRAKAHYQLKEYDKAWVDVRKAEELGYTVDPKFISDLKKALGK